ncbi:hypothetical protein BOTBODRAFT_30435 [Botryobasidium botryosum FD-172 SS1]|uniref:Peptidase A1 domain-containing protein n=1 Tax=Botryobasidium botryosum (strain FD-172 SS1) TaxID=930990 RepID=A0A067MZT9_BOTB1|nr:hypothetical protein BOTBODRAFT_30435 [Botryobasidium botryosum FD-172 SS1]
MPSFNFNTFVLVALLSLSSVLALPSPGAPKPVAIPLSRRGQHLHTHDDVPEVADLEGIQAHLALLGDKYDQTLAAFQRNTGKAHPLSLLRTILAPLNGINAPLAAPIAQTIAKPLLTALHTRADKEGALELTDSRNKMWYGSIDVGTPPVRFTVDIDTGSSDLFIPSAECETCGGHKPYNLSESETGRSLNQTYNLRFGDMSTTGVQLMEDTVSIAGIAAKSQTFGAALNYSSTFKKGVTDGLLGLGFPSIAVSNTAPLMDNLISQGAIREGVFGMYLAKEGSEAMFGGVNKDKFVGDLQWTPVTQPGFWQVNITGLGSDSSASAVTGQFSAIVDSGTTLFIGDKESVKNLYASIDGAQDASHTAGPGFYTVPCDNVPTVSVKFENTGSFEINPKVLNLGPIKKGSKDCVGGIIALPFGFWVVGDVFMRNVYTAFDVDHSRVGFAKLT